MKGWIGAINIDNILETVPNSFVGSYPIAKPFAIAYFGGLVKFGR